MLARNYRLTKTIDFDHVRQKGELFQSSSFALSVLDRGDGEPSRFGFIVSTKISKAATVRNRVKRAFREGVRQSLALVAKGYDCVILAKPIIIRRYTDEIMHEVRAALTSAKLIK